MSSENKSPLAQLGQFGVDDKFKHIQVRLIGHDGNIFAVMVTVRRALKRGGASRKEIAAFTKQVTTSESYDAALAVVFDWVSVSGDCGCGD